MSSSRAMHEINIPETGKAMLYLTACALHQAQPDRAYLDGVDMKALFRLCRKQTMTAITYMALESGGITETMHPGLKKVWKEETDRAIRKNLLLEAERTQILAEMEAAGIWYMPLKGSVLQNMYPRYGMRQMADNDILYDAGRQKDLQKLMLARGYTADSIGRYHHDVYLKEPIYNFEMHRKLISDVLPKQAAYYRNIKERLLPVETKQYEYRFTTEDFYVYMIMHAGKHEHLFGTGLRILADIYVYLQAKGAAMDKDYVARECRALEMEAFERCARSLSEALFGQCRWPDTAALDREEAEMLAECFDAGTFGTTEIYVRKRIDEMDEKAGDTNRRRRLRYLWKRLFPDMDWYRRNAPFCVKFKILIPFYRFYRLIRYRDLAKNELRVLDDMRRKDRETADASGEHKTM